MYVKIESVRSKIVQFASRAASATLPALPGKFGEVPCFDPKPEPGMRRGVLPPSPNPHLVELPGDFVGFQRSHHNGNALIFGLFQGIRIGLSAAHN